MDYGRSASPRGENYIRILASLIDACSSFPFSLNSSDVLDRFSKAALKISGMDRIVIALHKPECDAVEILSNRERSKVLECRLPDLGDEFERVYRGKVIAIEDTSKARLSAAIKKNLLVYNAKSCLAVPFKLDRKVLGAVCLYTTDGIQPISTGLIKAIEALASQAAVSIGNARTYEAECAKSVELAAILSSIPAGVIVFRGDKIAFFNKAAERIRGHPIELGARRDTAPLINMRDLTGRRLTLDELPSARAHKGEVFSGCEVLVETASGEDRILRVSGSPIHSQRGEITGAIIVFHDITDLRSTQARLEDALLERQLQGEELGLAANQLKLLLSAASSIGRSLNLDDALFETAEALYNLAKFKRIVIGIIDEDAKEVETRVILGPLHLKSGGRLGFADLPPEFHRAYETRQLSTIRIDDPTLSEATEQFLKRYNISSLLIAPIVYNERVIGHISVDNPSEPRQFSDGDKELIQGVTAYAAIAIANAKLYRSVKGTLSRTTLLSEITTAVTGSLDLKEIADRALESLRAHLNISAAGIHVINKSGAALEYIARFGVPDEVFNELRYIPLEVDTLSTRAFRTQKIITSQEQDHLPKLSEAAMSKIKRKEEHYVALPLIYRGRSVGAIVAIYPPERYLGNEEIETLRSAGGQVAAAVENARLFEAEQEAHQQEEERAKGLEMLHQITNIAISSLDTEELSHKAIEYLIGKFNITTASIWLIDREKGDLLVPVVGLGYPPGFFEKVPSISTGAEFETARVFTSGKPIIAEDLKTTALLSGTRGVIEKTGLKAGACAFLPLKARAATVGVISISWQKPRRFSQKDIEFYISVANQIAVGIENARLHEATERELAMVKVTNSVASAVASTLNIEELCARTLRAVSDYLGLRSSAIYVVDERAGVYRYITSLGTPAKVRDLIRKDIPIDEPSVIGVAAAQKQIVTPSTLKDCPELASYVAGLPIGNVKQMIYVPFVARGNVWAVLGGKLGRGFSLTRPIQQTLEAIGAQVAVGIENARRYETEKNIADTLQSALLAMPSEIPGVRFGSLYRSATEAAKVGGDFYELFELEYNRIGIIIGDVSGKGLEAATLTSLVKNTIKAYAFEGASPAVVMSKTNGIIRRASHDSGFVTVFFGILDTQVGDLVYCSGGHLPGLIKRTGSGVEVLLTNSPIIGAFADLDYCDDKTVLEKDDTLVLYTDGVTEARFRGDCFEEERLVCLLNKLTSVPVEEVPQAIFEQLEIYTDGNLSDDVVILTVGLDNQD